MVKSLQQDSRPEKVPTNDRSTWFFGRRLLGAVVMLLGVIVLFTPVLAGAWVIALLGIPLIAAGLFQLIETLRSADTAKTTFSYVGGFVTLLLGVVLFASPNAALIAVLAVLTVVLVFEGTLKILAAWQQTGGERFWSVLNGFANLALGVAIWLFYSAKLGFIAVGLTLGLRLIVEGWTMFFLPERSYGAPETSDLSEHPDVRLELAPNDSVAEVQKAVRDQFALLKDQNIYYSLTLIAIFFAIHALRTNAKWSFIGLISPFVAVLGDTVVALILGVAIILPVRLFWRKLTRPIERAGWAHAERISENGDEPTMIEKGVGLWLRGRLRFAIELREARFSLNYAFWRLLRIGLPVVAVLIAINSIWGFSWYFNSENWASGVYQEITKGRVDAWRSRMTADVESQAVAEGVPADQVFTIKPDGVPDSGDFSFIVIGDTGEGDPSQMSLRNQLIAASHRDDVKFLVLSSDVIYPDGKMKDYETNFYLPFMGFEKPVYAIPGNHDWFDANEGFNANFLDRGSAVTALRARLKEDVKSDLITTDERFSEITAEADRLRSYYGVRNGLQRGPYFEMHTAGFSLISVDTGILRRIDERQKAWLEAALVKAGSNFKMVVLGHPFYVAGRDLGAADDDLAEIRTILRRHDVGVIMAGDTHDFEYYRETYTDAAGNEREALNFVNGGGGAYLSVGTAIAFPSDPDVPDYAFYPRTDELKRKLLAETPFWRMPFYYWMEWFGGYPFDSEVVSGAFDFNRAPYFQSFVEVRVERSTGLLRILLYGVNGQLRWRDIEVGGSRVIPPGRSPDNPVEFTTPLSDRAPNFR